MFGGSLDAFRWVEPWDLHKQEGGRVVADAARWLESVRDRPFFAYVHLVDPHWPYYDRGQELIEPALRGFREPLSLYDLLNLPRHARKNRRFRDTPQLRELLARYDEEVRWADRALGELLRALADLGLDGRTLVVIVGDHGEEFFEHSSFGHGHDVYQQLIHVPLVVLWPDDPEFAGMPKRIDRPVSLLDVLPTLTDYLGLPPPPRPIRGHSLRPLLEETHTGPWFPVVSEVLYPRKVIAAYREGPLKVRIKYRHGGGPGKARSVQVFDLSTDPTESSPLPTTDPRVAGVLERANQLHQLAWNARRETFRAPPAPVDAPDPDEDAAARLRALGYVR